MFIFFEFLSEVVVQTYVAARQGDLSSLLLLTLFAFVFVNAVAFLNALRNEVFPSPALATVSATTPSSSQGVFAWPGRLWTILNDSKASAFKNTIGNFLQAGFAILSLINKVWWFFFLVILLVSFSLPWTFSTFAAKVYELNDIAGQFFGIRDTYAAFEQGLLWRIVFLVASTTVWTLLRLAVEGTKPSRSLSLNILYAASGAVLLGAMLNHTWYIVEFFLGNGERLVYAASYEGSWASVRAHVWLSPYYALTIGSLLSIVSIAGNLLVAVWNGVGAGFRRTRAVEAGSNGASLQDRLKRFGMPIEHIAPGAILSILLTLAAANFGSEIEGASTLIITPRLLLFNAIGDGLTLWCTLLVLRRLIGNRATNSPGVAKSNSHFGFKLISRMALIPLDLAVAALLAVGAVYFGVRSSGVDISLTEILYVLFGLDKTGEHVSFGDLFWVMHTTFIPTLIYFIFFYVAVISQILSFIFIPFDWLVEQMLKVLDPLGDILKGLIRFAVIGVFRQILVTSAVSEALAIVLISLPIVNKSWWHGIAISSLDPLFRGLNAAGF